MSLEVSEVRDLFHELYYFIDASQLVHLDTPFMMSSPTSITNKNRTVEEMLGEISAGLIRLLSTTSHVKIFGKDSIEGSRMMKGNVTKLHESVCSLFEMTDEVVGNMDKSF